MRRRARTTRAAAWSLIVNGLAASSLLPGKLRLRLYRAAGLGIETHRVEPGCFFSHPRITIGAGTYVNLQCFFSCWAPIAIGRDCDIASGVAFVTDSHELGPPERRAGDHLLRGITVGDGCWIGTRATILPGVEIGDGCVIAAGAVVTRDCDANGLYAGVPARRVRSLDDGA